MEQPHKHHDKKIDKALEDTFPASDPAPTSGKKTREERERRDAEDARESDEA